MAYEREKKDLEKILYDGSLAYRDGDGDSAAEQAKTWLGTELDRHRAQAYAHGVEAGRSQRRGPSWSDIAADLTPLLLALSLVLLVVLR